MRRVFSELVVLILLMGTVTLAFNIQPVKAGGGTIYIRADASIDPPTAPIVTVDGVTYTFTGNIYDSIVVERDDIVVDGAGYTVTGSGNGYNNGITLTDRSNVTVRNMTIRNFFGGIYLDSSSNSVLSGNKVTANNEDGIVLHSSSDNTLSGNDIIANNRYGIWLYSSSDNTLSGNDVTANNDYGIGLQYNSSDNSIFHNSFVNNKNQVYTEDSNNIWDDGYPSGGNYWSDYSGVDANGDGIGDAPYVIDADNQDRHPLMHPWSPLPVHNINTGLGYATIQEAINANETLNGHTIFAETGTYYENVVVNKTICLIGEDRSSTVIDGMQKGHVINVAANGVTITGFTITNSSLASSDSGIYLYEIDGCNIAQNNIINNNIGVFLEWASSNNISSNNITENSWCGIYLSYSSNNNVISLNNLEANNWYGIGLLWSSDINDITGNNITRNYYGIGLGDGSSYNAISRNNIANNLIGIGLRDNSNNNIIFGNNIEENNQYGVYFYNAPHNKFYHNNFISNPWQVYDASYMLAGVTPSTNVWDDGYPSGGNYWSDYVGVDVKSGSGQDLPGSDGVGDTQYIIDANNRDRYPLMYPYGTPPPPTYALTITTTVGGTTDPAPGIYSYTANSTGQVTAIPEANYIFDYWELDDINVGSANPYSVYMNKDHTLKAVFLAFPFPPHHPPLSPSISPLSASILVGQSVTFTSTVYGGYAPYSYQWYLNESLVSGATSSNWTFALEPSGNYSTGTYSVHLNVTDSMGNNAISNQADVTASLFGDLNNDSKVDITDVATVAMAFGSSPIRPRWNGQADLNQDGRVDITDVALVAKHFGQHYP